MRENKPVLLVLSAYDEEIILEKGEILSEKRQVACALKEMFHLSPIQNQKSPQKASNQHKQCFLNQPVKLI